MWDWSIWGALIVATVAGVAGIAHVVVAGLRFWRDLKRSRRRLFADLDALALSAEAVADRAAAAAAGTERLTRSLERLAVSQRRLAVLRQALDEATDSAAWLAALYPRK